MKKEKLLLILRSYQTIRFSFIAKRLALSDKEVERIVFELIVDEKISARINDVNPWSKYVEILPARNLFLEIQAENLNQVGTRFL
jgi:hypothetical protein